MARLITIMVVCGVCDASVNFPATADQVMKVNMGDVIETVKDLAVEGKEIVSELEAGHFPNVTEILDAGSKLVGLVKIFSPVLGGVFRIVLSFFEGLFGGGHVKTDDIYSKIIKQVRLMVARSVQNSRLKEVHETIKGMAEQFTRDIDQLSHPEKCTSDLVQAHKDLSARLGYLENNVFDESCMDVFSNGGHWSSTCIEWEKAGSALVAMYWAHLALHSHIALANVTKFCPQFTDRNVEEILNQYHSDTARYTKLLQHSFGTLKTYRLSSDTLKSPHLTDEKKHTVIGFFKKHDVFTWRNEGCTDAFPTGTDSWICSSHAQSTKCDGPTDAWGKHEDHRCRDQISALQGSDFAHYKTTVTQQLEELHQQVDTLNTFAQRKSSPPLEMQI